jgi:hypothetical protein
MQEIINKMLLRLINSAHHGKGRLAGKIQKNKTKKIKGDKKVINKKHRFLLFMMNFAVLTSLIKEKI